MDFAIENLRARQVFDSRGEPTLEVETHLSCGAFAAAMVPAGASTGRHEALELRDGDAAKFRGRGVLQAVTNVHEVLAPSLRGYDARDQDGVDARLIEVDGSDDKSRLGANTLLGASLSVARASAVASGVPLWQYLSRGAPFTLPLPMINIISGGLHTRGGVDFQDFLIMPTGAQSYGEALKMGIDVYQSTKDLLLADGYSTLKADEGGFGPALSGNEAAINVLTGAIERAGYRLGEDISIALDVAATHFFVRDTGQYALAADHQICDSSSLIELLASWVNRYPIISVEDGLGEDDWDGWRLLTARLGNAIQIVGDDFFTTNAARLLRGIDEHTANAILVKMNQIGTLTETFNVVDIAQRAGYRTIISARSGETEDPFIADLAVATGAGQIKIGSVAQSERLAKYNQLLRIEEAVGRDAVFHGRI